MKAVICTKYGAPEVLQLQEISKPIPKLHRPAPQLFDLFYNEHSTNLLSIEFLKMAKTHLNEKGVMYWNTTESKDVIYTAANAFSYVTSVANFVAGSDSPFDMTTAEREKNYPYFFRNSVPVFEKNDSTRIIRNKLINAQLPVLRDSLLKQNYWLITEDNMASEYKSAIWRRITKFKNSF